MPFSRGGRLFRQYPFHAVLERKKASPLCVVATLILAIRSEVGLFAEWISKVF